MSLYDIIKTDLKNGFSRWQIVQHLKSLPEYADMSESALDTIIDSVKREQ